MAGKTMVVENVIAMVRHDDTSSLTIRFQSEGREHSIVFPRNQIANVIAGLAGMQEPKSGNPVDVPPMRAREVMMYESTNPGDQDKYGLLFVLSGGWTIPFALPPHAIEPLRKILDDLDLSYKATGPAH